MALMIATAVANRQVFNMTVAALAERLDVLKCGIGWQYMFAAQPARHAAMQLAGNSFINFVAGVT
jgi:ankyrin repeat protein